jgi:hypothetical protein
LYFDIIKTKRRFPHGQYDITIILLLILVSQAIEDAKQFIFFESEVGNLKDESFETKEIALLSNDESEEEFNDLLQKAINDEKNKISKIDENYSLCIFDDEMEEEITERKFGSNYRFNFWRGVFPLQKFFNKII